MEYLSAGSASDTGLGLHGSQMKRSHRLRVEGVLRTVMRFPELLTLVTACFVNPE